MASSNISICLVENYTQKKSDGMLGSRSSFEPGASKTSHDVSDPLHSWAGWSHQHSLSSMSNWFDIYDPFSESTQCVAWGPPLNHSHPTDNYIMLKLTWS